MFLGIGELYKWGSGTGVTGASAAFIVWNKNTNKWVEVHSGKFEKSESAPGISPYAVRDYMRYVDSAGNIQIESGTWGNEGDSKVVPTSPTGNYDVIPPPSYHTEAEMLEYFRNYDIMMAAQPTSNTNTADVAITPTTAQLFGLPWYIPVIGVGALGLLLLKKI